VQLAPRENPFLPGSPRFPGASPISEGTQRLVDREIQRILEECHEEARRLLLAHREQLDALVKALLERETLDEAEILAVTGLSRAPALEGVPRQQTGV